MSSSNLAPTSLDVEVKVNISSRSADFVRVVVYLFTATHIILFITLKQYYKNEDDSLKNIMLSNKVEIYMGLVFPIFSALPIAHQLVLEHRDLINNSKNSMSAINPSDIALFPRYLSLAALNSISIPMLFVLSSTKTNHIDLYMQFFIDLQIFVFGIVMLKYIEISKFNIARTIENIMVIIYLCCTFPFRMYIVNLSLRMFFLAIFCYYTYLYIAKNRQKFLVDKSTTSAFIPLSLYTSVVIFLVVWIPIRLILYPDVFLYSNCSFSFLMIRIYGTSMFIMFNSSIISHYCFVKYVKSAELLQQQVDLVEDLRQGVGLFS